MNRSRHLCCQAMSLVLLLSACGVVVAYPYRSFITREVLFKKWYDTDATLARLARELMGQRYSWPRESTDDLVEFLDLHDRRYHEKSGGKILDGWGNAIRLVPTNKDPSTLILESAGPDAAFAAEPNDDVAIELDIWTEPQWSRWPVQDRIARLENPANWLVLFAVLAAWPCVVLACSRGVRRKLRAVLGCMGMLLAVGLVNGWPCSYATKIKIHWGIGRNNDVSAGMVDGRLYVSSSLLYRVSKSIVRPLNRRRVQDIRSPDWRESSGFGWSLVTIVSTLDARHQYLRSATVPVWHVLLFTVVVSGIALRPCFITRWRKRHGRCVPCGYDLTGNDSGVCPECGQKKG